MTLRPATKEAYELLHKGAIAFSRIEEAGIRIDTDYLNRIIQVVKKQIHDLGERLRAASEWQIWVKLYGNKMTLTNAQLGRVVFEGLGHKRNPQMYDHHKQHWRNDAQAFAHVDLSFVQDYFEQARLKKALSTNLYGIRREVVDGRLHPFFDLHTAESYRGSSSRPNLQNIPIRNKAIAEAIRRCMVPSPGCIFLEADYSGQEVRISCCYNKDPKLRNYICGGGDMHADMARKLYLLDEEPSKEARYCAKNMFVFPQFYGSYYAQCAPNLWEAIDRMHLTPTDGTSLYEHLHHKGLCRLGACDPEKETVAGTYEAHVRSVERYMWDEVFTVYRDWKVAWWDSYRRQGGVNTLTGFLMEGIFRRNQVLCDPLQGSAFHCMLWSIIQIQREFRRHKLKSRIVNTIHDSMLVDCVQSELADVVAIIRQVATVDIAKHWQWLTVPLVVEFDVAENNWHEKHKLEAI